MYKSEQMYEYVGGSTIVQDKQKQTNINNRVKQLLKNKIENHIL